MIKTYELSEQTMTLIFNTLQWYSDLGSYQGERVSGVLAGCQRKQKPTPDELIMPAVLALSHIERVIR